MTLLWIGIILTILVVNIILAIVCYKPPENQDKDQERICTNCRYFIGCEHAMYYAYTKKQCEDFKPKQIELKTNDTCVSCGGYADDGHLCWECRQKSKG